MVLAWVGLRVLWDLRSWATSERKQSKWVPLIIAFVDEHHDAADGFHDLAAQYGAEKGLLFGEANCSVVPDFCQEYSVDRFPSYRLIRDDLVEDAANYADIVAGELSDHVEPGEGGFRGGEVPSFHLSLGSRPLAAAACLAELRRVAGYWVRRGARFTFGQGADEVSTLGVFPHSGFNVTRRVRPADIENAVARWPYSFDRNWTVEAAAEFTLARLVIAATGIDEAVGSLRRGGADTRFGGISGAHPHAAYGFDSRQKCTISGGSALEVLRELDNCGRGRGVALGAGLAAVSAPLFGVALYIMRSGQREELRRD